MCEFCNTIYKTPEEEDLEDGACKKCRATGYAEGSSNLRWYSNHPDWMLWSQFIETEVKERGNYPLEEVKEWEKKYGLTPDMLVKWVTAKKWIANRYNLLAEEWDTAQDIPEDQMSIIEVPKPFTLINESDDGDHGYLAISREGQPETQKDKAQIK